VSAQKTSVDPGFSKTAHDRAHCREPACYVAHMLWLLLLVLFGAMMFVMFHKPTVNSAGAGWVPPEQRLDATPKATDAKADGSGATARASSPSSEQHVVAAPVVDFNDLYRPTQPAKRNDEPRA
jgi:hypothetical protein